jgi:hypothetical protein
VEGFGKAYNGSREKRLNFLLLATTGGTVNNVNRNYFLKAKLQVRFLPQGRQGTWLGSYIFSSWHVNETISIEMS